MKIRRIDTVFWLGAASTSVLVGLLTAIWHSRIIMPILAVIAGTSITCRVLWKWQEQPYAAAIRASLKGGGVALDMFLLAGSLVLLALFIGGLGYATLSVRATPCVCVEGERLGAWFDLVLDAALFSPAIGAMLLSVILAVIRLAGDVGEARNRTRMP